MDTDQLKAYCRDFPGASERDSGEPGNIFSYLVGGKKFAYFKTSEPERWRFSIKVSSERFLELTDQPGIKPARYMQRFHWVTIVDVTQLPEDYLQELVSWSYAEALSKLPKKQQRLLLPVY